MNPFTLLFYAWLFCAAIMLLLNCIEIWRKDATHVDVGWAALLGILGVSFAYFGEGDVIRRILLALCVGLWSLRLTLYLFINRVLHEKEEDGRYQRMRRYWGKSAHLHFLWFFQAQAVVDVLLSIPFLVAAYNTLTAPTVWDIIGLFIVIISIGGEALSDWQLAKFKTNPQNKGKTCRAGLWKYSRHPNYFFEWIFWWTFVFMSVGSPYFWLSFISPLLMLYFVLFVTGIPFTEMQAISKRGDDYRQYQRTTSAFIPWFPKKDQL